MKHLNKYIKESLLDDEESLMKNTEDDVYDSLLGKLKKAWRIIDKTIVYAPRDEQLKLLDGHANLYLSEGNKGNNRNDFSYDQLSKLKKAGLKFQTLEYVFIEYDKIYTQSDILKLLPCSEIGTMKLLLMRANGYDFNKLDGKIKHLIQILPQQQEINSKLEIVPPKYHIGAVHYSSTYSTPNLSTNIKNWDCDYLIVPGYEMMCGVLDHHKPTTMCGFWIDEIQKLIDSNPDAKEIYVYDNNTYWRCSCKGTGKNRKLVKLTNRTEKYISNIISQYQWKSKNEAKEDTRKLLNK